MKLTLLFVNTQRNFVFRGRSTPDRRSSPRPAGASWTRRDSGSTKPAVVSSPTSTVAFRTSYSADRDCQSRRRGEPCRGGHQTGLTVRLLTASPGCRAQRDRSRRVRPESRATDRLRWGHRTRWIGPELQPCPRRAEAATEPRRSHDGATSRQPRPRITLRHLSEPAVPRTSRSDDHPGGWADRPAAAIMRPWMRSSSRPATSRPSGRSGSAWTARNGRRRSWRSFAATRKAPPRAGPARSPARPARSPDRSSGSDRSPARPAFPGQSQRPGQRVTRTVPSAEGAAAVRFRHWAVVIRKSPTSDR